MHVVVVMRAMRHCRVGYTCYKWGGQWEVLCYRLF